MPSTLPQLPVRTSQALRDLIAQAGPVNAAVRALLILGAHAVGLDIGPAIEPEIYSLLACPTLDPAIRVALGAVEIHAPVPASRIGDSTGAVTGDSTGAVTLPAREDDPFAGIGIEV
jgi:hypothetical protein